MEKGMGYCKGKGYVDSGEKFLPLVNQKENSVKRDKSKCFGCLGH